MQDAAATVLIALTFLGCGTTGPSVQPWPEADRLFQRDASWIGGDGASSVDLGNGRVLWLFADSIVCVTPGCSRSSAELIRNSVAIQTGYDPSSATATFTWRSSGGKPASFFTEERETWFWPGSGVRLGDIALIFLMKIRGSTEGLGFEVYGWTAVLVENPREPPTSWRLRRVDTIDNPFGVVIGSASVFREGDWLYAVSASEPRHDVYLTRWPVTSASAGNLAEPQWWVGGSDWRRQSELTSAPAILFSDAQTEFTVHYDPRAHEYIAFQTTGFGAADIAIRRSKVLTGPWPAAVPLHRPAESSRTDVLVYQAKAHPELRGADVILTYIANAKSLETLIRDRRLYFARFLRVSLSGGRHAGDHDRVAGRSQSWERRSWVAPTGPARARPASPSPPPAHRPSAIRRW